MINGESYKVVVAEAGKLALKNNREKTENQLKELKKQLKQLRTKQLKHQKKSKFLENSYQCI